MWWLMRGLMWINTRPKEIRPGLITSIDAAYTPDELRELICGTRLDHCTVTSNPIGLSLSGTK